MQNASVDVADLLATNGVLHVLSQVLLPPREAVLGGRGLLQLLDSVPAFRLFRDLLQVRARGVGSAWSGAPSPRDTGS